MPVPGRELARLAGSHHRAGGSRACGNVLVLVARRHVALVDALHDLCRAVPLWTAQEVVAFVLVRLVYHFFLQNPVLMSTTARNGKQGQNVLLDHVLESHNTHSTTSVTGRLGDEEKVRTAGLEVVERLEAVDRYLRLRKQRQVEIRNLLGLVRVVAQQLNRFLSATHRAKYSTTHLLEDEDTNEAVLLPSLVHRNTREPR